MAFKIVCTLAVLTVAAVSGGFIDAPGHLAYTGHSNHHEYAPAPVAKFAYSAPSVNHVYSTVKEISHTPVHHYTAPAHESVEYAPVHKTVEYTPVVHKTVHSYDHHHSTPSHTLAYPVQKAVTHETVQYTPVHKTVEYTPVVQKNVHSYDHHYSTPSHTLAYPIQKAVAYAPIAKTISYAAPTTVHHHEPTYQHTHESVERNHAGTVSHYGKTVSTPHSHVQKYDTRVTNEQYKVAVAPAVHYKVAPVVHHEAPQVHHYTHSKPIGLEYSQPAPVQQYVHSAPVQHHHHSAPVQHYTAPTQQYAHAAPVVSYNKAVNYSPAEAVSHTSFHSNDAKYEW